MGKIFSIAAFLIVLTFTILAPTPANGQLDNLTAGTLSLTLNPTYPGPKTSVYASLESFSTDLNRADITWTLNGKTAKRGIGETKFNFMTGVAGSESRLLVTVSKQEGGMLSAEQVVRPAEVDILWQSQTHTPPFYRGKALHSSQSPVTVIALPHFVSDGKAINPDNLVYNWTRNGKPLLDQSGYGKSSIKITGAKIFGRDIIEAVVTTKNNQISAKQRTMVNTVDPEILFYEDRGLLGPHYEGTMSGTFALTSQELVVRAEPYFVSLPEFESGKINYTWTVDGKRVNPDAENPLKLILRQEGGSGTARLTLSLKNPLRSLQEATASVFLKFGGIGDSGAGQFFDSR